jgi:hypothetical protein
MNQIINFQGNYLELLGHSKIINIPKNQGVLYALEYLTGKTKIGMTLNPSDRLPLYQNDFNKFINDFSSIKTFLLGPFYNTYLIEQLLLRHLKSRKYKILQGNEWFEIDLNILIKVFDDRVFLDELNKYNNEFYIENEDGKELDKNRLNSLIEQWFNETNFETINWSTDPIGKIFKENLTRINRWKNKSRGNPKKGYDGMKEKERLKDFF